MDFISVNVDDLPVSLTHDFMPLGGGYSECILCFAVFDMPTAGDERCPKREEELRNWGDPFRTDQSR